MVAVEAAYVQAAHSALEWVLTVGVVPITFQKLYLTEVLVPIVPVPESLSLFVRVSSAGEKVFEACLKKDFNLVNRFTSGMGKGGEGKTPKIVVWGGTHYTPTALGELVTPITHLQSSEEFINFLKQRTLVAEHIKSNPPIVSQNRKQSNTDMEGIAFGVDENTIRQVEEESMRRKEEVANQQLLMHSEWTGNVVPRGEGDTAAFMQSVQPHEYFVSHNRDPTRVDKPESVDRLPELLRWSEEKIYQIFGLPFGLFSNTGVSVQSNKMQELAMNVNINKHRSSIQRFLNDVFVLSTMMQSGTKTNNDTMEDGVIAESEENEELNFDLRITTRSEHSRRPKAAKQENNANKTNEPKGSNGSNETKDEAKSEDKGEAKGGVKGANGSKETKGSNKTKGSKETKGTNETKGTKGMKFSDKANTAVIEIVPLPMLTLTEITQLVTSEILSTKEAQEVIAMTTGISEKIISDKRKGNDDDAAEKQKQKEAEAQTQESIKSSAKAIEALMTEVKRLRSDIAHLQGGGESKKSKTV